ncbi:MAG: O-antigen ligase family protein [Pseudomonadota bacterium]
MNNLPPSTSQPSSGMESPFWLEWAIRALVFLFPITVATTGWGSEIFLLLVAPALYYGRGWSMLSQWEKRLLLGYVAVFVVMSLSMLNAEELREGGKALERYLRFVLLIPVYLMFRRYGFTFGRELALGAVVAAMLMLGQALYQVEWQGMPIAEGYYHKIVFGDLAVWWAAVTTLFAVTIVRSWKLRLALVVVVFMALYASLLSQTRGAWLFVPVFPVILIWAQWGHVKAMRKWVVAGGLAGLGLLVIVGTQSEQLKGGFERGINELEVFVKHPEAETSWGIRLNLWRNSLLLLKETPLLGTGVGDFQADMKRMVEDGRSWNKYVANYNHAHSIYIDTLVKGGVLGFVVMVTSFLLLPFIAFVRVVRSAEQPRERFYAVGGVLLIAAFATFGLSEGLWSRNPFVNTYVICLVVFMAGMVNSRKKADAELDKRL